MAKYYIFQLIGYKKLGCTAIATDVYQNIESNIIAEVINQILNGTVEIVDEKNYNDNFLETDTYIRLTSNSFAHILSSKYTLCSAPDILNIYKSVDMSKLYVKPSSSKEDDIDPQLFV